MSITHVYWIVIEVTTDTGCTGTGWMESLGFGPELMAEFVDSQFRGLLLGRSPFELKAIHEDLRRQSIYYGETAMAAWARGAIDVALCDFKAKAAGEPLYRYLGGLDRRVPVCVSLMDATEDDVAVVAGRHGEYADLVASAFKTKDGNWPAEVERRRVEAIRDQNGEGADLFVDANQAWTVKEAIKHVDAMNNADVGWVDEPISKWGLGGTSGSVRRLIRRLQLGRCSLPLERRVFLLDVGIVDVVQPDLIRLGGVTWMQEAAAMAHRHNVPMAPHFYFAVSAHVVSTAPGLYR